MATILLPPDSNIADFYNKKKKPSKRKKVILWNKDKKRYFS